MHWCTKLAVERCTIFSERWNGTSSCCSWCCGCDVVVYDSYIVVAVEIRCTRDDISCIPGWSCFGRESGRCSRVVQSDTLEYTEIVISTTCNLHQNITWVLPPQGITTRIYFFKSKKSTPEKGPFCSSLPLGIPSFRGFPAGDTTLCSATCWWSLVKH